MRFNREVAWVMVAMAFAAFLLPVLVFYTGTATLGPYARGDLGAFLSDYVADLARLSPGAWVLLLGPVALVAVWRVLIALAWPRAGK